jgi:prevent-host-death family protein
VTIDDYLVVMRTVRIADLKARLSEHLRAVRRGQTLTVMDRSTPIAWVVPYAAGGEALIVREPAGHSPSLQRVPLPPPLKLRIDIVDLLLEDRRGDR